MTRRHSPDPQVKRKASQPKSLGERLSGWLRRQPDRPEPEAATVEPPPPPLSAKEIEALQASYLHHLREQTRTIHLYGLDDRRRAAQASGQALDLAALYTPLNTTLQVRVEQEPAPEAGMQAAEGVIQTSQACETRPMSLLEAVGRGRRGDAGLRAILRGPHGAGKSTFLRFVALALAKEPRHQIHAGPERLGASWSHGRPFPLLVDLHGFADTAHDGGTAHGLCAYIAAGLSISAAQLQSQLILPGGMLIMLDGLEMAHEAVADLIARFGHAPNHWLVASQEYVQLGERLAAFDEIHLAPWTVEQMDLYVQRWYAELAGKEWVVDESARDLQVQLRALLRRPEIAALAGRPALMALIAKLHMLHGCLPASKVQFYHELVSLSLACWSEGKSDDERDLRQVFDPEGLRAAVAQVTYQEYARLEDPTGLVELSARELRAMLLTVCRDGRWEAVDELVTRMLTRPGLLDERAAGVYVYPHLAVQAYAVASHLAMQPDLPRLAADLVRENRKWREPIVMAAQLAHRRVPGSAAALIDVLCDRLLPSNRKELPSNTQWRTAWLAGQVLQSLPDEARKELTASRPHIRSWLLALLERGMLTPWERAQVGGVLDRLPGGDPRPGVNTPEPLWCAVPQSAFWQGDGDAAQRIDLDAFWIARYPVTNAQYAAFVEATGQSAPRSWQGNRPPPGAGNHPVVSITWDDATAYCQWWNGQMRGARLLLWQGGRAEIAHQIPQQWMVRLPTSVEWEKAARGGLLIPSADGQGQVENPLPRRIYPWGDTWQLSTPGQPGDETRCNVSESDIGSTTPVGMYPSGASPYGLLDMAGNVWEWCLDQADQEGRYKIRRGGAFRYTHEHARCAAYDKAYLGLGWPYLGFRLALGRPIAPPTSQRSDRRW
jgi:formylglycine-generating enzyme required for sulfatase activity